MRDTCSGQAFRGGHGAVRHLLLPRGMSQPCGGVPASVPRLLPPTPSTLLVFNRPHLTENRAWSGLWRRSGGGLALPLPSVHELCDSGWAVWLSEPQ